MVSSAKRRNTHRGTQAEPGRFLAFILEQSPFAFPWVRDQLQSSLGKEWDKERQKLSYDAHAYGCRLADRLVEQMDWGLQGVSDPIPGVSAEMRLHQERERFRASLYGYFEREAIRESFTTEERRWMLEGIILTRAVDNRMKHMFLSGELKYGPLGFQGKGFRSLGQEAIFAAGLRLQRGPAYDVDGTWRGDVVAPLIRDLGLALSFTDDVEMALNAQAGKHGAPMNGKDLHLGDAKRGVLPAAAPLTIATCTVTGMALAMKLRDEARVGVSCIGEGGSSLGEWHEAINLAAVRKLPLIFCLQNNQTALSTRVTEQSAVRIFAEKAAGYGMPHLTLDGTDPEEVAAAFAWGAGRARRGEGPVLLELVAMRMCGHAHHDDMLYLGGDPQLDFEIPPLTQDGYVDPEKYEFWRARDPLGRYAQKLIQDGLITEEDVDAMKETATARCDVAMARIAARPWPAGDLAGSGVTTDGVASTHPSPTAVPPLPTTNVIADMAVEVEMAPPFSSKGSTYLDGVARGIADAMHAYPEVFVLGEDVAAPYGNAFLLLKPLLAQHGARLLNTPIAEGAIIGAAVGAALEGMRPIAEMQFNDFVASGFNELVNNAAKLHYRTGLPVPMVLRMPWGGLRRAGPYHSQDTSPWFYRTFGLKIVAPSTPADARALMMSAVQDDNPVLFYEHIGLYRDPKIKQLLSDEPPTPIPLGKAAWRKLGDDLSIISYGAYVHRAMRVADELGAELGASIEVLDLRSLAPLDWDAIQATVERTGKVLLVGEDSRTGSILESIASRVSESLFLHLDAPVRVLGALDAPVPYSPSLEDAYLVNHALLKDTVCALLSW